MSQALIPNQLSFSIFSKELINRIEPALYGKSQRFLTKFPAFTSAKQDGKSEILGVFYCSAAESLDGVKSILVRLLVGS